MAESVREDCQAGRLLVLRYWPILCRASGPAVQPAAQYNADAGLTAFAAGLKRDAVDLDPIRDDLAAVVHLALVAAHVAVRICRRLRLPLPLRHYRQACLRSCASTEDAVHR
jgi:hypothetical protein